MASRKGTLLGDDNWGKNCLDYRALPPGFASANFQGPQQNPFMLGIKTPKYQRAAPRPQSADVQAVSIARITHASQGISAPEAARDILTKFNAEAKTFKNTPRNIRPVAPTVLASGTSVAPVMPTGSSGTSRGESIQKQWIGGDVQIPKTKTRRFLFWYER